MHSVVNISQLLKDRNITVRGGSLLFSVSVFFMLLAVCACLHKQKDLLMLRFHVGLKYGHIRYLFNLTAGLDRFYILCVLPLFHCRSSRGLRRAGRHRQQWACQCRRTQVWRCRSTATPWCSPRPTRGLCRTQTKDTQTGSSAKMDSYGESPERNRASWVNRFFCLFFTVQCRRVLSVTDFISCSMLLNQPMQTLVPTSSVTSQPSQCNMGISQTMWVQFK